MPDTSGPLPPFNPHGVPQQPARHRLHSVHLTYMPEALTTPDIMAAARNDSYGEFTLGKDGESKTFQLKHLGYDAYVEFCEGVRPILAVAQSALSIGNNNGEFKLEFNPMTIDFAEVIRLSGKDLPRLATLICRQSEPKITVEEVKRLAGRPQVLVTLILRQIKHNEMIQEFSDFFPQLVEQVQALLPAATTAVTPTPMETPTTEPTA